MEELLLFASILAPIVLALVQLIKKTVTENHELNHLLPLFALVVGLMVGFAATPFTDLDWTMRLWAGGIAGLAATGLFEIADNTTEKGLK